MARDGENGIKGQYGFVNGVWKYTRVLDDDGAAQRSEPFTEDTPLIRDVSTSRYSIASSTSTLNNSGKSTTGSHGCLNDGSNRNSVRKSVTVPSGEGSAPNEEEEEGMATVFIRRNIEGVKGLVERVMGKILERGERLDTMRERAADSSTQHPNHPSQLHNPNSLTRTLNTRIRIHTRILALQTVIVRPLGNLILRNRRHIHPLSSLSRSRRRTRRGL
ncbi:hypothetical protein HDU97_004544 [Phlyctochytrium planicorne]|nr:hypothetical protein HDU97_004544 [Phlyctochytrium planicorne]